MHEVREKVEHKRGQGPVSRVAARKTFMHFSLDPWTRVQIVCCSSNIMSFTCTGNGRVVPSLSHKREVAGSIPSWVNKNFSLPSSAVTSPTNVILLCLAPSTLPKNPHSTEQHRTGQHCTEKDNMLVPPTWRTTAQPQQSIGEERIEATKSSTLWERH
jgi:hypothetical protein